jgi:CHAT domain-containing protein/SIR2-like protein
MNRADKNFEVVELEMAFYAMAGDYVRIEVRSQIDRTQLDAPIEATFLFPREELLQTADWQEYGKRLATAIFSQQQVIDRFRIAKAISLDKEVPLRLRLRVDPSARLLDAVRWETLSDPLSAQPLTMNQNVYFSRFVPRTDFRSVRLRRKGELKALLAISNPSNIDTFSLASVDKALELPPIEQTLREIDTVTLKKGERLTINNLVRELSHEIDILYLVCHGVFKDGDTSLFLEDDSGMVKRTTGAEFVTRLSELRQRPRLVVLVSCQTGGTGTEPTTMDNGVLSALGPRIAESGVPAVIAMQGNITMKTASMFMPVFFEELRKDGQLDRAMAVARGAVRDRSDCFVPVLFSRLLEGRIWYEPGFTGESVFDKWPSVLSNTLNGACTPILGPGLLESMVGSTREIAARIAERHSYPLSDDGRDDLADVCQFVETAQDAATMRNELQSEFSRQLVRRYSPVIPELLKGQALLDRINSPEIGGELNELLLLVWSYRCTHHKPEPHYILSRLPFKKYLTTCPVRLLETAMHGVKEPFSWIDDRSSVDGPNHLASKERPLIIYLGGTFDNPDSLVCSQDNYFEYLLQTAKKPAASTSEVNSTLVNSALLFLGFRLQEWDFRVLLRSILSLNGANRNRNFAHVAVQVDPVDGGGERDPGAIRRYLEKYFQNVKISIFWGSVDDFMAELQKRWNVFNPQARIL